MNMPFVEYAKTSAKLSDVEGKFKLACQQEICGESDVWILSEDEKYELCDFIARGVFPGFLTKESAEFFCQLANDEKMEDATNHFVKEIQFSPNFKYWTVD